MQSIVSYVPNKVDQVLRAAVARVAASVGLGGGTNAGPLTEKLTPERYVNYNGQRYAVWAAKDSANAKIKVALQTGNTYTFVGELTAAQFSNSGAISPRAQFVTLRDAANALARPNSPNPPVTALQTLQTAVVAALTAIPDDALGSACVALNGGCFAAEMKFSTPQGYRKVEDIQAGETVFARDESNPDGPIEAKVVEKKFVRLGRIAHLHLEDGQLIRTTPEHRFYVRDQGWTAASTLRSGEYIRTDNGWTAVAEVFDTGTYETVYNLRVAEHHSYFVGDDGWGLAVWAHNTYLTNAQRQHYLAIGRTAYDPAGGQQTVTSDSGQQVIVTGRPQQTFPAMGPSAGPHVTGILVVLGQMVANGGYTEIYLNRRYHTIPGFNVNSALPGATNKADIVGIRRAGQFLIDICEILSIGQDVQVPLDSALQGMALLTNPARRGDINVFNDRGTGIVRTA
jgi:hypothetical protein